MVQLLAALRRRKAVQAEALQPRTELRRYVCKKSEILDWERNFFIDFLVRTFGSEKKERVAKAKFWELIYQSNCLSSCMCVLSFLLSFSEWRKVTQPLHISRKKVHRLKHGSVTSRPLKVNNDRLTNKTDRASDRMKNLKTDGNERS